MTEDILYPPLDTKSDCTEDSNMILSHKLKRSFEAVHRIHLSQKRLKIENLEKKLDDDGNGEANESEKEEEEDLDAKKLNAAVAAAVAAESEISKLMNGIEELESILLSQESSEANDELKFPTLPSEIEDEAR